MGCRLVLNPSRHRPTGSSGRIAPDRGRDPQSLRINPLHGPITEPGKARSRSLERTRAPRCMQPAVPIQDGGHAEFIRPAGDPITRLEGEAGAPRTRQLARHSAPSIAEPSRLACDSNANIRTGAGQGGPFCPRGPRIPAGTRSLDEAKRNPGKGPVQASSPNSGLCPHPGYPVIHPRRGGSSETHFAADHATRNLARNQSLRSRIRTPSRLTAFFSAQ
jgi:hypothetical protein